MSGALKILVVGVVAVGVAVLAYWLFITFGPDAAASVTGAY